jgi:hypothetical protein
LLPILQLFPIDNLLLHVIAQFELIKHFSPIVNSPVEFRVMFGLNT